MTKCADVVWRLAILGALLFILKIAWRVWDFINYIEPMIGVR